MKVTDYSGDPDSEEKRTIIRLTTKIMKVLIKEKEVTYYEYISALMNAVLSVMIQSKQTPLLIIKQLSNMQAIIMDKHDDIEARQKEMGKA